MDVRNSETANKAKTIVLCKKLGLNTSKLNDDEWRVMMKVLDTSGPVKRAKNRK